MYPEKFLILSSIIFCLGLFGALTSQNFIKFLMTIELLFNAANLNFITFSNSLDQSNLQGHIFVIFIITIAAAETGIGLAIILTSYRNLNSIEFNSFNKLKK
uniref:NAD(P)H-quinone oxidoreductase subunit 4L, chloroplastic n=1 Tax=Palmophyllum crassum TaxID=1615899 RepID=A0A1L7NY30_9VIRI|nr:NADH dehydrogenase subunit 4L [Palmophyllum crassum]BAW34830.1 NADH dehydrogenase subunit 4L [Palmophyllum crassum]